MKTLSTSTFLLLASLIVARAWSPGWLLQSAALGLTVAIAPLHDTLPPPPLSMDERIQQSLKPASDEKPQIMIPMKLLPIDESKPKPLVQGVVYLADSQERPGPRDTLILTVRDYNYPDEVLAGAKVPVSKTRFPLEFTMYSKNILPEKQELWNNAEGDFLVKAKVCPEGTTLPCSDEESNMKAQGISKLIKYLPGMDEGSQIRAGASLRLERI